MRYGVLSQEKMHAWVYLFNLYRNCVYIPWITWLLENWNKHTTIASAIRIIIFRANLALTRSVPVMDYGLRC